MKKIWKRNEDCGNSNFLSYIKYIESSQKDTSVKGYWNVLNGALLDATDSVCG